MSTMRIMNATFQAFKNSPSYKWGYTGRGVLPMNAFHGSLSSEERLSHIMEWNGGLWPGMSTAATDYFRVIIPDDHVDFGWPLMFGPDDPVLLIESRVERHPGPFQGQDAAFARKCAIAAIKDYGDETGEEFNRIVIRGMIHNDHVAVQSALAAIHSIRKAR